MSSYNNVINSLLKFSETAQWQQRQEEFKYLVKGLAKMLLIKRFVILLATSMASLSLFAVEPTYNGVVKFGASMGVDSPPSPIVIITPYRQFNGCHALGVANLVNGAIDIQLSTMTCAVEDGLYEYILSGVKVMDVSWQPLVSARHYPPSKNLLDIIENYRRLGYVEGLKFMANAALGHWDLEPETPVKLNFESEPFLKKKIAILN